MWLKADGHGTLRAALKAATTPVFIQPTSGGWSRRTKADLLGFRCLYYSFIWLQFLVHLPIIIRFWLHCLLALGEVAVWYSKKSTHRHFIKTAHYVFKPHEPETNSIKTVHFNSILTHNVLTQKTNSGALSDYSQREKVFTFQISHSFIYKY